MTALHEALSNLGDFPILWRVLLNSAVIAILAAWLGVQILSRGIVFLGLAVAQGAVAGMTLAFWLRFHSLIGALLFVLGTVLTLGSGRVRVKEEGEEGKVAILYVTFLALAVLFLVFNPRGEGRMLRIFYGNFTRFPCHCFANLLSCQEVFYCLDSPGDWRHTRQHYAGFLHLVAIPLNNRSHADLGMGPCLAIHDLVIGTHGVCRSSRNSDSGK